MKKLLILILIPTMLVAGDIVKKAVATMPKQYVTDLNKPDTTRTVLISPTLNNGGFETAGAGGADVFASWTEYTPNGRIADTSLSTSGSHACLMNGGTNYAVISKATTSGKQYAFSAVVRSSGSANVLVKGVGNDYRFLGIGSSPTQIYLQGAGSASNKLEIIAEGSQTFIIDDITLTELTPVSKAEYWARPYTDSIPSSGTDFTVQGAFLLSSTGIMDIVNASKTASSRIQFYLNNTTPTATVTDGTNTATATNTTVITDGKYHTYAVEFKRATGLKVFVDGVAGASASIASVGAITVDTVRIGRGVSTNYFSGAIGQTMFLKGTLPDSSYYKTQTSLYKAGKALTPFSGATKALDVDWNTKKGGFNAIGGATTRRK